MTITVKKLIESLEKLSPELPVYAVDGGSGVSIQVSAASLAHAEFDRDDGDLLELVEGAEYAYIYTGN